ncbi:hypothetical protein Tco_0134688 [Tanacetum coccineum]
MDAILNTEDVNVGQTPTSSTVNPKPGTSGPYPPLPTQVTTLADNAPGNSSYANVTGKPSGMKLNFRTLFTPGANGIDVVVPVESIRTISERFANTAYGLFLGERVATLFSMDGLDAMLENGLCEDGLSAIATKLGTPLMLDSYTADMCMQSWGRSSYARAMIELRADVELKDNIVAAMPKITREGYYTCNISVEYEWKPPRCACCKIFGHVLEECLKNIGAGATKNLKKTSQTPKGIPGTTNVNSSNTPIGEKIDKIERQIYEGKLMFMDDDGNPLVPTGIVDSDSEVKVLFDEIANLRLSTSGKDGSDKGYSTNSLCEYFIWNDDARLRPIGSPRPSTPPSSSPRRSQPPSSSSGYYGSTPSLEETECANCKLLALKIKKLEATLDMERHRKNHPCQSVLILHELVNDMEKLGVE